MAKKRRPLHDDFDDDLGLEELDILDLCGDQNALLGRALYQHGFVSQRSFDGESIHGTIKEDPGNLPVVVSLIDFSSSCSDTRHLRRGEFACEHIAALMYAYLREPESFLPQNIGGFIDLLDKNSQERDQLTSEPEFKQVLAQIQRMSPAARAALDKLQLDATPEQIATLAEVNTPEQELESLLRGLSLAQLRGIAKRRDWKLSADTKERVVEELANFLATAPLPAEFSSEEEQLLRLENSFYGLMDTPGHQTLQALWRARAGGDMARFERAVRGLQSAGVMFPCTQSGAALHYHWSPLIRSETAPHLVPKTKLYPAEKIAQLKQAEPLMPLTTIVDAVIELAEHEPLRIQPLKIDPRFGNQPWVEGWELDPQELEQYAELRYFPNNAITIPFPSFWADETVRKLDALSREVAGWIAAFIFGGKFFELAGDLARLNPEQVNLWRAQSEEERWEYLWLGWRAGAAALAELRAATERASLVAQRAPYVQGFRPQDFLAEVASARQLIARLLAPLDPLVWYSFKSFAEYVRGLRSDFLHTATTQETWWLAARKTHHRFDPNNTQNWDGSYRAVLAAMLEGTLRWMGVTEVAYEGKELAAFRITPLGASLLSGGTVSALTQVADPNAPSVAWLDDSTLRLRATPDAARAMSLVRAFADPTRESLTFRVSNASIARAFDRGVTVAEIAEKSAGLNAPLPEPLRKKMDGLSANYGRAHVYEHLTVVEFADDFTLRELLASTALSQLLVHQFSPRLIVVRDDQVDEWVNEMVKKGYTPRVMTHAK